MNVPYNFRLMACLPGQSPVELMRAKGRHYQQADWDFWCRDMLDRWECWVEMPLTDRQCISDRPKLARITRTDKLKIHLTHEQKVEAGVI